MARSFFDLRGFPLQVCRSLVWSELSSNGRNGTHGSGGFIAYLHQLAPLKARRANLLLIRVNK